MRTLIVIPTHLQGRRLPGKPLRWLNGQRLLAVIIKEVLEFDIADVVVAADSQQIVDVVADLVPCYLTSSGCRNGTERVAEVLRKSEFDDVEIVVNVQGDQLFLPRYAIEGPVKCVHQGLASLATAVGPLSMEAKVNPNRVKVLVERYTQSCLAFFRLMAIGGRMKQVQAWPEVAEHIGVYVYTRQALEDWVALPSTLLELELGLEQVRPLAAAMDMKAAWVEKVPTTVDTEEDLKHVRAAFGSREFKEDA